MLSSGKLKDKLKISYITVKLFMKKIQYMKKMNQKYNEVLIKKWNYNKQNKMYNLIVSILIKYFIFI